MFKGNIIRYILDISGMLWDNWKPLLDCHVQPEEVPEELPLVALLPRGVRLAVHLPGRHPIQHSTTGKTIFEKLLENSKGFLRTLI